MTIRSAKYWKDVLLQTSGNGAAQLIGIAGIPILARLYGPESFAIQSIFVQMVILLAALITFRYEYFIPLLNDEYEYRSLSAWILNCGVLLSTLFTLAFAALHFVGVWGYWGLPESLLYILAPLSALMVSLALMCQFEVQRRGDFKISALAEVVSKFFYVAGGVTLSQLSSGIGLVLTTAFGAVGKIIFLKRVFWIGVNSDLPSSRSLLRRFGTRSVGMVFSNTLLAIGGAIPLYFLGAVYDANSLGQFALVITTIFLPTGLIGTAAGNVFYQRAAQLWNEQESTAISSLWRTTVVKLAALAIPIFVIFYIISPWIYPLIFGDEWGLAGRLAQAMTLAAFFSFMAAPLDRLSLIINRGFYLPSIHGLRFLAVLGYFAIAERQSVESLVLGYSLVMAVVYLLDIVLCRALMRWVCAKEDKVFR
ncbi:lipopolysaccharide biosynthesis protein [Stutzerimonas nitrititolerans]|uniref:lipopolysaccharide biosynthesis protein n=1 Tax=Stutzerimonas nitrititolerans TaxID=2482751 RepID=UPI0028AB04F2|nr:lipopolysaccharide biosynthesis protein [Stutzerimonas nitrititolerans]